MLKIIAVALAALVYVYAIGWVITWTQLTAARLSVGAALPQINSKTVFATGVRLVLVMALVFAAMCALAYLMHAWTWDARGAEWHAVVKHGRARARELASERAKRGQPAATLRDAPIGDPFVRVIAGFNVAAVAATLGLALATPIKALIDQWQPGHWWDLIAPWLLLTLVFCGVLAAIGPLRGGRILHAIMWSLVVVLALLSSAPIGLLLLTLAAIATVGRSYGRTHSKPGSNLDFVFSPLPWMMLAIYTLVGIAYYAMPPVSFSQAIVTATGGRYVGGFLARNSAGVYLATCTPLADAHSTGESVSFVPADEVRSVVTTGTAFDLDSGLRPSLPTLVLHAFGIGASLPSVVEVKVKATKPTCAGDPLPSSSIGNLDPALGAGVIAGPAPPGGVAHDGEEPVQVTSPQIAAFAKRFEPTLLVTVADRFWPVSVDALLQDVGSDGQHTCLDYGRDVCGISHPTLADLTPASNPNDFLVYPTNPPQDPDPTGQLLAFLRGQEQEGGASVSRPPLPSQDQWLANPGLLDPWRTAEIYFYYAGYANPSTWPAGDPGGEIPDGKLIALEYWFFYQYNYYPTAATPDLMNAAPIAGDVVNTDLHQGDWEHVTVLVDPVTGQPEWLYMARHSDEGEYYPWDSPQLSFDDGHPIIQAAYGGHPSYDPHCGPRLRFAHGLDGLVSDWVVCGSGRFAFRAGTTPLVDLATTSWGCWQGHFGFANGDEVATNVNESSIQRALDANVFVAGPRSPLWQAENGHLTADYHSQKHDTGVCAAGDPAAPEKAAIASGLALHLERITTGAPALALRNTPVKAAASSRDTSSERSSTRK